MDERSHLEHQGRHQYLAHRWRFVSTAADTRTVGGTTGTTVSWYPTSLVQDWVDGIAANDGLIVKQTSESVSNVLSFNSSEASSDPPQLVVWYEARIGESPQFTFLRQQLGDRLGVAINVANGNGITSQRQFSLAGRNGFDFAFDSWHNSQANRTWYAGVGWEDQLTADVRNEFGDCSVEIYLPTGTDVVFKPDGAGGYTSPPSIDATLTKDSGDGSFTVTYNKTDTKLHFLSWGGLDTMKDKHSNTIAIHRGLSGYPDYVTDSNGGETDISYTADGYIEQLTDPTSRTYQFAHDDLSSPQLVTSYTDANGYTAQFVDGTSMNSQVAKVIAPLGNEVEFTYENTWLGSVTSMTLDSAPDPGSGIGPTWNFSYATSDSNCPGGTFNVTYVQDPNTHTTTYCSDREARVTKTIDPLTHTSAAAWNAAGRQTSSTDGLSHSTTFAYSTDGRNNLTGTQMSTGASHSLSYTDSSHPYYATGHTDAQSTAGHTCTTRSATSTRKTRPPARTRSSSSTTPTARSRPRSTRSGRLPAPVQPSPDSEVRPARSRQRTATSTTPTGT